MVIGRVIEGMNVVKQIESVPVGKDDKPIETVMIENCGEIQNKRTRSNSTSSSSTSSTSSSEE